MAVNVEAKPTAAFALSVIAGLTTLFVAILYNSYSGLGPLLLLNTDPTMVMVWGSIAGILIVAGSWLLFNNAAQRRLGSILTLVFSLISMNILGLILGLIGGFLGYTYKTTTSTTTPGRSYNPP